MNRERRKLWGAVAAALGVGVGAVGAIMGIVAFVFVLFLGWRGALDLFSVLAADTKRNWHSTARWEWYWLMSLLFAWQMVRQVTDAINRLRMETIIQNGKLDSAVAELRMIKYGVLARLPKELRGDDV